MNLIEEGSEGSEQLCPQPLLEAPWAWALMAAGARIPEPEPVQILEITAYQVLRVLGNQTLTVVKGMPPDGLLIIEVMNHIRVGQSKMIHIGLFHHGRRKEVCRLSLLCPLIRDGCQATPVV